MASVLYDCGICILAGGLSRRMGRNKASLRLGSRTLLGQIRAEARDLGLPLRAVRHDLVPRCGPLGGVYTALKTSRAAAELFLACDMPFVSARLMERLLDSWEADRVPVFMTSAQGAGFPFLAPVNVLPIVARQISRKQYSLQKLAQILEARLIPSLAIESGELFNVNTPEAWRVARALWRAAQRR